MSYLSIGKEIHLEKLNRELDRLMLIWEQTRLELNYHFDRTNTIIEYNHKRSMARCNKLEALQVKEKTGKQPIEDNLIMAYNRQTYKAILAYQVKAEKLEAKKAMYKAMIEQVEEAIKRIETIGVLVIPNNAYACNAPQVETGETVTA